MTQQQGPVRSAIPLLTSLRFFAAALVVGDHFFEPSRRDWLGALGTSGYECVIFFFVLSGFILTYVYSGPAATDGPTASAPTFWKARFARIAPAYGLALVIGLPAFAYAALVSQITPIGTFVAGLILVPLCLQAWWSPAAFLWNAPAWSLSAEAFFYAAFPFIARRMTGSLRAAFVLSLALLVITGAVVLWLTPDPGAPQDAWTFRNHFPLFHISSFIFGMVLGHVFLFGRRLSITTHRALFAAGTALAIGLLASRYVSPPWAFNNSVMALAFGLLIYGAAGSGAVPLLTSKPLVTLGEASYGLYILHMPLMFWWDRAAPHLRLDGESPATFLVFFSGAVGLSVAVLLWWEHPMRRLILRGGRRKAA